MHLVRARFCEQHEVFPFALESVGGRRQLVLAMADPLNPSAVEEIEFTTGLKVSPRVAALSIVRAAILRYYHKVTPEAAAGTSRPAPSARPPAARGASQRPPASARTRPPPKDDDEEVIVGEEVGPGETTERTSLAELIRKREEQRRQRRGQGEAKSRSAGGSGVLDDLEYLIGDLREEPDRVEELERKFWALMRIMARKGLLSKEEFTRELDDTDEKS